MSLKVVTGEVRLCFPYLLEPRPARTDNDKPKYGVQVLIPKTDTKTIKALRAAEKKALEEQKSKLEGRKVNKPSILKDADDDETAEEYPEREGCMYMNVSANLDFPPEVVDSKLRDLLDLPEREQKKLLYSGVFGRVSVAAFVYNFQGSRGVSFGLNNVQVFGRGERIGGGTSARNEFEAIEDDDDDFSVEDDDDLM